MGCGQRRRGVGRHARHGGEQLGLDYSPQCEAVTGRCKPLGARLTGLKMDFDRWSLGVSLCLADRITGSPHFEPVASEGRWDWLPPL